MMKRDHHQHPGSQGYGLLPRLTVVALLLLAALTGCHMIPRNQEKGMVLAEVDGHYLYDTDMEGVVPEGISPGDSVALVHGYINNWVRDQLMIRQAEKNLTPDQLDFSRQLEAYRNSLIKFRYETLLLEQELDTVVSDQEIIAYYQDHPNDFQLRENIIRAYYAMVLPGTGMADTLEQVFMLPDSIMVDSLLFFEDHPSIYNMNVDTSYWMTYDNFSELIPVETYNQELFLKHNRVIRVTDEEMDYVALVVNFKIKDDLSPLEVEKQDIRNIIINQRKVEFIRKVRKDIFDQAVRDKAFEIY